MKTEFILLLMVAFTLFAACQETEIIDKVQEEENLPDISAYPIVGTNQTIFFNNQNKISTQNIGDDFYGQNANYPGTAPSYTDNEDGTVTDNVTGLMWQQWFDHNGDGSDYDDKLTYDEILSYVEDGVSFAGYDDWRLPNIKEMYSLILFGGRDISPESTLEEGLTPFIDDEPLALKQIAAYIQKITMVGVGCAVL